MQLGNFKIERRRTPTQRANFITWGYRVQIKLISKRHVLVITSTWRFEIITSQENIKP